MPSKTLTLLALLSGLSLAFCVAVAVGELSEDKPMPEAEPELAGKRVEVGRGEIPGLGTYRILQSGSRCTAMEIPVPGGKTALAEGCSGGGQMSLGTLTDHEGKWTLVAGRVADEISEVTVTTPRHPAVTVPARDDAHGLPGRFVAADFSGSLKEATAVGRDDQGRQVATQDLPD